MFILSECPDGYFGLGCANTCSSRCSGCNTVNGSCDKGCLPGWKEDYCDQRNKHILCFYVKKNKTSVKTHFD